MPRMTDPTDALKSLQAALNAQEMSMQPCRLYSDLRVYLDHPNGGTRFTYARFQHGCAVALALFALAEPLNGLQVFQIGYAVMERNRRQGLGTAVVTDGIKELCHGFSGTPLEGFYLEAVVEASNEASIRIASKVLGVSSTPCKDSYTGLPALQYLKLVSLSAA